MGWIQWSDFISFESSRYELFYIKSNEKECHIHFTKDFFNKNQLWWTISKIHFGILNITYDPIVLHEIHGFSDASLEGYGSCVQLKTIEKKIWEPLGILLLSWSVFTLKKALHAIITECEALYRTDSSV